MSYPSVIVISLSLSQHRCYCHCHSFKALSHCCDCHSTVSTPTAINSIVTICQSTFTIIRLSFILYFTVASLLWYHHCSRAVRMSLHCHITVSTVDFPAMSLWLMSPSQYCLCHHHVAVLHPGGGGGGGGCRWVRESPTLY